MYSDTLFARIQQKKWATGKAFQHVGILISKQTNILNEHSANNIVHDILETKSENLLITHSTVTQHTQNKCRCNTLVIHGLFYLTM